MKAITYAILVGAPLGCDNAAAWTVAALDDQGFAVLTTVDGKTRD